MPVPAFADRFNDVLVTAQSVTAGETYHGYREMRVLVENLSGKSTHRITLVYPDRSFSFGNSISRLSRTVSLGPGSRALVPLWQPPLPASGNGTVRVVLDDEEVGTVSLPDAVRHVARGGYPGYGAQAPATVLVSRSVAIDDVGRALKPSGGPVGYSAGMATGAPDSAGRSTVVSTAWMPNPSSSGPHWLELTYATPRPADKVRIYSTGYLPLGTSIRLLGASGTNLHVVTVTTYSGSATGAKVLSFPPTTEPVASVRLEFTSGGSIAIDAVEVSGPSGLAWASSATASSDASGAYAATASSETLQLLRCELAAAEWSEAWLSYTPYDGIALSGADLRAMSPATVEALWRYAECGGNLLLLGGGEVPEPWRSFARNAIEGGDWHQVGFGQCFVLKDAAPAGWDAAAVKQITDTLGTSARFWQGLPMENDANATFPVIENYKVPVRGTVMIMLLFVIVIGPVNVIVLSRMNRRTWLLWTIPAISVVSCVMVFAYSLVREGVTPTVRIEGVTVLDQLNRRATTVGAEAFYCPLTPSRGLSFGFDTEAAPLVAASRRGDSGTQREVDWTQGQHLGRGWITARVPAHFQVRKTETRRERLQVEDSDGRLSVVNGLGATVRSLWLAQPDGRIYFAHDIPAGQKADLTLRPEHPPVKRSTIHILLQNVRFGPMLPLINDAPSYLSAGTYIADLDANPFLENGLGTASAHRRLGGTVYGILEPARQP